MEQDRGRSLGHGSGWAGHRGGRADPAVARVPGGIVYSPAKEGSTSVRPADSMSGSARPSRWTSTRSCRAATSTSCSTPASVHRTEVAEACLRANRAGKDAITIAGLSIRRRSWAVRPPRARRRRQGGGPPDLRDGPVDYLTSPSRWPRCRTSDLRGDPPGDGSPT